MERIIQIINTLNRCFKPAVLKCAESRFGRLCKWIILLFNLIFILVGGGLVGINVYLLFFAKGHDINIISLAVMGLGIVVGLLLFIISSFGFFGACFEKKFIIQKYCIVLTVATKIAIVNGVLPSFKTEMFSEQVMKLYSLFLTECQRQGNAFYYFVLEKFHTFFECCGDDQNNGVCGKLGLSSSTSCSTVISEKGKLLAEVLLKVFLGLAGVMYAVLFCSTVLYYRLNNFEDPPAGMEMSVLKLDVKSRRSRTL